MYRTGRGDYVGGYGDPGFLGSLGRAIVHIGAGAVGGFVTKGPVGAIIGAASGAGTALRKNIAASTLEAGPTGSAYTPALKKQHAAVVARSKHGITKPIGSTTSVGPHQYSEAPGRMVAPAGAVQVAAHMGGYHLMKAGPLKGQVLVRNRRMNWANPRALGRAERRIHAAVKHFTKYIRWVHPQRPGHAVPKFGKHRASRKK